MSGTKATNPAIRPPAESTRPPSMNPREIGEDSSGSCMWQRRSWGSSSRWGMRALLLAGGRSSSSGGRRQGSRTLSLVPAPGMARGSGGCCGVVPSLELLPRRGGWGGRPCGSPRGGTGTRARAKCCWGTRKEKVDAQGVTRDKSLEQLQLGQVWLTGDGRISRFHGAKPRGRFGLPWSD